MMSRREVVLSQSRYVPEMKSIKYQVAQPFGRYQLDLTDCKQLTLQTVCPFRVISYRNFKNDSKPLLADKQV